MRKSSLPITALIVMLCLCGAALQAGYRNIETLYQTGFDSPDELREWTNSPGKYLQDGALVMQAQKVGEVGILSLPLPVEKLRGKFIHAEARIRGKEVKPSPKYSYLGTKFMFACKSPDRGLFPEIDRTYGTYDWRPATLVMKVPDDAQGLSFCTGIQDAVGEYALDDLKISICEYTDAELPPPSQPNPQAEAIPRGNGGTKYRGVMSGADMSEEAFQTLSDWKVNLIRYQNGFSGKQEMTEEQYLDWIDQRIIAIDKTLEKCKRYNIKMVIDLHTGPGTLITEVASNEITDSQKTLQTLKKAWKKLAEHYRGNELIYGYDLLNEPQCDSKTWDMIANELIAEIRAVDPDTYIITEPDFSTAKKYADDKVIYSPHFYTPHSLTHQRIGNWTDMKWQYPGWINGVYWDKDQLRIALEPVIRFQRENQVPIFVGEFSCIIWSKGREQYIADAIAIFEEYGWDWTYHAFREWSPWSVEHSYINGECVRSDDTPAKEALLRGLSGQLAPQHDIWSKLKELFR